MSGDYPVLAHIYDRIGMNAFGDQMTPQIIDYIQRCGWMGRQILDLGTGTGASLAWVTKHGYITTGMDQAPEMIEVAADNFAALGLSCRHVVQDIRQIDYPGEFDLALAINTLNEMSSISDLENTFHSVHRILKDSQWFVFDLYTIQGLLQQLGDQQVLQHASTDSLSVFSISQFDYERQMHQRRFTIFHKADETWQRQHADLVRRAYPIKGVAALLKRCGFTIVDIVGLDFETYHPDSSRADRVIFIAQKE